MRKKAEKELKKRYAIAEEIIKDKNKLDDFLERLERKIKEVPKKEEKFPRKHPICPFFYTSHPLEYILFCKTEQK